MADARVVGTGGRGQSSEATAEEIVNGLDTSRLEISPRQSEGATGAIQSPTQAATPVATPTNEGQAAQVSRMDDEDLSWIFGQKQGSPTTADVQRPEVAQQSEARVADQREDQQGPKHVEYPMQQRTAMSYGDRGSRIPELANLNLFAEDKTPRVTQEQTDEFIRQEVTNMRTGVTPLTQQSQAQQSMQEVDSTRVDDDSDVDVKSPDSNIVKDVDKGWNPATNFGRMSYADELPTSVFPKAQQEIEESSKQALMSKGWDGNAFTEKARCDSKLDPIDVSVGFEVISEIIREPKNEFLAIVKEASGVDLTVDDVIANPGYFIDLVNSLNIDVVATKSPVGQPSDYQRRRLRIHSGRGIGIHPTQVKSYNADFDGDDIAISFSTHDAIKNAMTYMVNIDGKPMIDPDVLLLPSISGDKKIFTFRFKAVFLNAFQEAGCNIDDLVDIMFDLCNPVVGDLGKDDAKKFLDKKWVAALQEMMNIAETYAAIRKGQTIDSRSYGDIDAVNVAMSDILKDIYDGMLDIRQNEIAATAVMFDDDGAQYENRMDEYVHMVIGDMSRGIEPPNFQDFITGMNAYVGEIEDKNVYFRIGGKYAKGINFNENLFFGTEEDSGFALYQVTLAAGEAMFMNGRATIGEKVLYLQKMAAHRVYDKVGLPPAGASDLAQWLIRFRTEYNRQMAAVQSAKVTFACDMDPLYDPDLNDYYIPTDDKVDLSKFTTAILQVYGNLTIEQFFGKDRFVFTEYIKDGLDWSFDSDTKTFSLLSVYRKMTLREFALNNHFAIKKQSNGKKYVVKPKRGRESSGGQSGIFPSYLLGTIADKRTAQMGTYYQNLTDSKDGLLIDFVRAFKDLNNKGVSRFSSKADFLVSMKEMMAALHMSGPGMFEYYNMNNPLSFANSEWGQMFYAASQSFSLYSNERKQINAVGGIRATMVFRYRLRRIESIRNEIDHLLGSEELISYYDSHVQTVSGIPYRINQLQNRMIGELKALGSSSDLWRVLANEMLGGPNTFVQISAKICKDAKLSEKLDKASLDFWKNKSSKYSSLCEVMNDPNIGFDIKNSVARDVVAFETGLFATSATHMPFQLEMEADASHTALSLMAYKEQPSVISSIQEARNRFKKTFNEDWDAVVEDVGNTADYVGKNPGALDHYLLNLAENPELFLEIPNEFYADAIAAQMIKSKHSAEKNAQEIPVDGIYVAREMQIGGMTDGVYRVDDRTFGKIPESMLSAYDLVQVLANPSLSKIVYNSDYEWTLSRKSLCGSNSEKDLLDMLKANPRIAALLRPGLVSSGNKGNTIYRNSKASLYDGVVSTHVGSVAGSSIEYSFDDLLFGNIKSKLCDAPVFLSLAAMIVPIHGLESRSVRKDHCKAINTVLRKISNAAFQSIGHGIFPTLADFVLDKSFGISVESLTATGMAEEDAANWYRVLQYYVLEYVKAARDILVTYGADKIYRDHREFTEKLFSNVDILEYPKFDLQSIALAQDCRQTFTGAKTDTSVGVEGQITRNHLGTGLYASSVDDGYDIIDGSMAEEYLQQFAGCMTNMGLFDGTNFDELEAKLGNSDTPLVIELPPGMTRQDPTLDNRGKQVSTLSRFISIKRSKGTEEYNLKVKKSGDDGLDSITKTTRYVDGALDNLAKVQRVYDNTPLDEDGSSRSKLFMARLKLAEIYMQADQAEGYKDMDLADYMCLASVMVKEVVDEGLGEGTIVVRSLGQISTAVRQNMDQSVIENGTPKEIIAAATEIADGLIPRRLEGEELADVALSALSSIKSTPSITKTPKFMMKHSESAPERNYQLISQIMEGGTIELPWGGSITRKPVDVKSQKQLDYISTKMDLGYLSFPEQQAAQKAAKVAKAQTKEEAKTGRKAEKKKTSSVARHAGIYSMLATPFESWRKNGGNFYCPICVSKAKEKGYSKTKERSAGPQAVWVLEKGVSAEQVKEAVEECYAYGMTLAFTDESVLGDYLGIFGREIIQAPFGNGYKMIPFFSMRLNGSSLSAPMTPGTGDDSPSYYRVMAEDRDNFYGIGDAYVLSDYESMRGVVCNAGDVYSIPISDLFYNVFHCDEKDEHGRSIKNLVQSIEFPSIDEVRRNIVDYVDDGPAFDLGRSVWNPYSDESLQKFGLQIKEYASRLSEADEYGLLSGVDMQPDRIMGWIKLTIIGSDKPVYAPIIPFPTGSSGHAPTMFQANASMSDEGSTVDIAWHISKPLDGQVLKLFAGHNASDKSVTVVDAGVDLGRLRNGRKCDHIVAAFSNDGREIATARKMATLSTLALIAKFDYGFNFADCDDSFPDDPDIKRILSDGYVEKYKWKNIVKTMNKPGHRYSLDPVVDGFVRELVAAAMKTGNYNPTDFLACTFGKNIDQKTKVTRYVDYNFFFRPEDEFVDGLLAFYNKMIPELCPPRIDAFYDQPLSADATDSDIEGRYLFKPVTTGDRFARGTLQMLVPFKYNGRWIYRWNNVFLSMCFFNEDYSMMHKPSLNGSHRTMEQVSAMKISGRYVSSADMRQYALNAASPSFKSWGNFELHLDYPKFVNGER